MPRAYIVLTRNDLDENLLQLLDLVPNTSTRNFPYTPEGQTGYLSNYVQNDAIVLADQGAGVFAPTATVVGLAAYLMDNVENTTGGTLALTAANAANISAAILVRAAAGTPLTLANLNLDVVAVLGGGNDLEGTLGASTGSVEAVLQVLAGAVYQIPALTPISGAANAFLAAPAGGFTALGTIGHRNLRVIVDTPDLHRSVLLGAAAKLVDTAFLFNNPSFTYGAGGTATTINGTAIGTNFQGRAVMVYKATGEVI